MRIIIASALLLASPLIVQAADPAEKQASEDVVVKSESKSVFKGLLYKVWGKLRSYNPTAIDRNRNRSVVTAGVRGNETTTSIIQPYWKDDQTNDPNYMAQLKAYSDAQAMAEEGDLTSAVNALSAFIDEYDESDLKPNAQFALGLSYGGLGDKASSVAALNRFVEEHPEHPLVADARQVIAELR